MFDPTIMSNQGQAVNVPNPLSRKQASDFNAKQTTKMPGFSDTTVRYRKSK